MRTKLLRVWVGVSVLMLCAVLAFATTTKQQAEYLSPQDVQTLNFPAPRAACSLTRTNGTPAGYYSAYGAGMRNVTYLDPSVLCAAPQYPLQLNSLSFTLYGFTGAVWPVTMDVVVYGMSTAGNVCGGPGTELSRFTVTCGQAEFGYPAVGTATFPAPCCVNGPFYVGLEYTDAGAGPFPSILFDNATADTCVNWFYMTGQWVEWYDLWNPPVPGNPILSVAGETVSQACPQSFYYKPGYVDYCPNGMPDFDQKQDFSIPPDGLIDHGYCGPTAVANCFWWFDSKFEPNPVPPPTYNDGYPLVQTYATMPPLWDDHDPLNPVPFINALGTAFNTNITAPGTNIVDMHNGILAWLASRQLQNDYILTQYDCQGLTWDLLAHEVRRSQDVILLIGFYVSVDGNPNNCCRIGGHYVTVAGIDSLNRKIAFSDPYYDATPSAIPHNDAAIVSHDIWDMIPMGPMMCEPHQGCLFMPGYPVAQFITDFYNQNGGATCPFPPPPGPMWAIVENAEVLCPKPAPSTCEYYKLPYPDYAPVGMPDFDQKQNGWIGWNGGWSFCGPLAALNCLWWFDSKFEPNTIPPPSVIDNYPLLQSPSLVVDDHDQSNVPNYVNMLSPMMNCLPGGFGTNIHQLALGMQQWITNAGLQSRYIISQHPAPTFEQIRDSVLHSQDVILLLGFWQEIPGNPPYCTRIGGHYVTVAGVCTTSTRICISDPYFDHAEGEPPAGSAHPSIVHNDAQFVSGPHGTMNHDVYNVAPRLFQCPNQPIPLGLEITDYPDNFADIIQFERMNQPIEPPLIGTPQPGLPVYTMIEWATVVCPTKPCPPGPAYGDSTTNDPCILVCPRSDAIFTVTEKDSCGNLVCDLTGTWLDFSQCPARPCPNEEPAWPRVFPDSCRNGVHYFSVDAGGLMCGPCVAGLIVNGQFLRTVPVSFFDINGDLCVKQPDFVGGPCNDYDCNGIVDLNDATIFALHIGHCCTFCDCYPGDANGDGALDISDAVYLIQYIFAGGPAPTPYAVCSGDANCDGSVDISDAVYLIQYIFSGGAAPCSCADWFYQYGPPHKE